MNLCAEISPAKLDIQVHVVGLITFVIVVNLSSNILGTVIYPDIYVSRMQRTQKNDRANW